MAIHTWKSKSSDLFVTLLLLLLFALVAHVFISSGISTRRYHHHYISGRHIEPFSERLTNPLNICISVMGSLLAFSPIYIFKRKVPKSITLDDDQDLLIVQKRTRKKSQTIALRGAGYLYYSVSGFSVLEIYHDFETNRGTFRKRYLTVLVPKFGMSITDKHLKQLVSLLQQNGLTEEPNVKKRTWNELIYE